MKAVVYDKRNSHDVLALQKVEKPMPNDNEVLVKIYAVSLNAADYRSMKMGIIPKRKVFGADIAGQVEAIGRNIRRLKVGDEVFGDTSACGFGGFAEYTTCPESALALKPVGVSFETAAAVPMAAVTALQALRNKGNIQPRFKRSSGSGSAACGYSLGPVRRSGFDGGGCLIGGQPRTEVDRPNDQRTQDYPDFRNDRAAVRAVPFLP
jgi:NADPH:quinone reductase-like Zn-dependent oxidoreductase